MSEEGLRRSTRVRKQVKSYAIEQADEEDRAPSAPPPKRRKKQLILDDDHDAEYNNDSDVPATASTKNAKGKKSKSSNEDDEARADGLTKNGLHLFVTGVETTGADNRWHADAAERRIAVSKRNISKLVPGEEETRLRPYVEDAPKTYKDSLKRANSQRMFVLARERGVENDCHANHNDCPCETVKLAGSTGNVYTIIITHTPSCTCPAGVFKRKGQETLCKHALYILHNVLKAPEHLKQQNAFLTSELKEIFSNAPALPSQIAEEDKESNVRKCIEGDCPICFMDFEDGEDIVWCRAACGNNIHKACFDQWASMKGAARVTCPFCRSAWENEIPKTQKLNVATVNMPEERSKGGYRNVRDQLDYD